MIFYIHFQHLKNVKTLISTISKIKGFIMNSVKKKQGFTMIEVILVIVIIGILSAIAIPKLAENKSNAMAKVCKVEATQFIVELSGYYTKYYNWDPIQEMTILALGVDATPGNGEHGLSVLNGYIPQEDQEMRYLCNGEVVMKITPQKRLFTDERGVEHEQYELDVPTVDMPTTTAAKIVVEELANDGFYKTNPGYRIGGN